MSTPTPVHPPPRAAEALLRRWLPDGVVGLSILGDLYEEYEARAERGRTTARLWFGWNAVALSARYAWERAKRAALESDSWGGTIVEGIRTWVADVRFGLRMLWKTPLLSSVAVVTIALGVALTTHTFSTVYGSIIRGVPVPDHERLMSLGATRLDIGVSETEMYVRDFEELRRSQRSFDDVAGFYQGTVNVAGEAAPPERFAGAYVSANALTHVGVQPLLGRVFREGEDGPDAPDLIVIGHHVWQNRFAGDPDVIGRVVRVNGRATEVIGVMPEGFRFPFLEDVWLTHRLDVLGVSATDDIEVFGRVRETVTLDAARAELDAIAARLAETYPETNEGLGMYASPYSDRFMPDEIQAVIWLMLGATFGVLLIACANVANLLMARASVRAREVAIRTALGARRWRLVRQLLVESLVLAAIGGAFGVVLAAIGVDIYQGMVADIEKPYWIEFRMDVQVLVFSVVVTAVSAVVAGIFPALRASAVHVGEYLKDESRGSSSLRLGRFSQALVVSEIAVSCALLIAAGFMVRSIVNLERVDLGFETERVMTGRVALFATEYPDAESRDLFFARLLERLRAEPGIESAALTSDLPGLGGAQYYFGVEGQAYATDQEYPFARASVVTPGLFETLGVELAQGRDFHALEARLDGDAVAVVNESFARTYLGDSSPLGERIRIGRSTSERPWLTIVGVVPDMHVGGNVGGLGDDQERLERIFLPQGALDVSFMSFAVRTQGPPEEKSADLRALVTELDPNLPVYELTPLGTAIDDATWAFGMFGSLFTIFGIAALFLATVGLYGVMSFGVSQRRQEMGVRLALGAAPDAIVRMVLGRGARQLTVGVVLGLVLGAVMGRAMSVITYGVDVADPLVYGTIVGTLGAVGMLACLLPARSATRTDPVEAMRSG